MQTWVYVQAVQGVENVRFRHGIVTASSEEEAYARGHQLDDADVLSDNGPSLGEHRLNDYVVPIGPAPTI